MSVKTLVAISIFGATVASAAYAGERCFTGNAYVGTIGGNQVAAGCGPPPNDPGITYTTCSGPYLEYDVRVIGDDPVAFCAESSPVTSGCPTGWYQFRGISDDSVSWTCSESSCVDSSGGSGDCATSCAAAGGSYVASDNTCSELPLCNASEDCSESGQLGTCSPVTGRCGQTCGSGTFCYGNSGYCTNPTAGTCARCSGSISFSENDDWVCSSASTDPVSSTAAQARRKRAAEYLRAQLLLKNPDCPATPGVQACAIRGGRGAVECINTLNELESCGGCSFGGDGVDCTAIPNVAHGGVACMEGSCVVRVCKAGFTLTNGSVCQSGTE